MARNWREEKCTPQQMLEDVQAIKLEMVLAMNDPVALSIAKENAFNLLNKNLMPILDILDDAIYRYILDGSKL